MVGKTENILVDFDYNNITIIDPNKVLGEDGRGKERYVNQEDLVMYANLECKVLPRTKLAAGVAANDRVQTLSIATINFLKPGDKEFLDNSYTDELTGKNSLQGKGVNQPSQKQVPSEVKKGEDWYLRQTIKSNGEEKATDNGLLGISRINIRQGLDFMPSFNIELIDVKGRALFEAGNSSPYAAFFNMPYPMFELTVKGFYGKAIKYKLMLRSFNARYDSYSSNFIVDLAFYTYKFSAIAEVSMGYLLAVPHMYTSRYSVKTATGGPSNLTDVTDVTSTKGFGKVKEMYTEYKTKGLIPENFPELTIVRMRNNIENFIKNILDSFTKQNMDPLTNVETYQKMLNEFRGKVMYYDKTSWLDKYMDKTNFLIINSPNTGSLKSAVKATGTDANTLASMGKSSSTVQGKTLKIYTFKPEFTANERNNAITELKTNILPHYRKILGENDTLGTKGKYTIDGKTNNSSIPVDIKDDIFEISFTEDQLNLSETYRQVKGIKSDPTKEQLTKFKADLIAKKYLNDQTIVIKDGNTIAKFDWFYFDGKNSFLDKINDLSSQTGKWREKIQDDLTNALAKLLQSSDNGIGFVPNIRNVLAVVFANGEAFLRLMDDVHSAAWEERLNPLRKKAIFDNTVSNANPDNLSSGVNELLPVYPWPTYMVATTGENGHEKFEYKYPGDNDVIGSTNGDLLNIWPEIEFVEEFLKGFTARASEPQLPSPKFNEVTDVQRITLNAIEFPISNTVYQNKEEVKYFYELFERILFLTNYSRLNRTNGFVSAADKTANLIAESEVINIKESLSNDNPFLIKKLKEYSLNSQNFVQVLEHISNQGVGVSWQNYIRGIYNTPYIKQLSESDNFLFMDEAVFENPISKPNVSLTKEDEFIDYLTGSTTSNAFDLLDTYPFIDSTWCKNNLSDSGTISLSRDAFNTTKTLTFDKKYKTITSFSINPSSYPITNFVYENIVMPKPQTNPTFTDFYSTRKPDTQIITEGNLNYNNYSGYVSSNQTISMLNTPYFVNSIQEGVKNFRNYDKHPYVSAGYLFLNSLPLSTLREKNKSYSNGATLDLDYIFAGLKKFGALHKLPYAWIVKLGSVWHRYKRYVNDGVDILDGVWKDFDYVTNFDPVTSAKTKDYTFTVNGGTIDIILEKNSTYGTDTTSLINTGFYPKLINDFNVFYQGYNIFTGYTSSDIQSGVDNYGLSLQYVDSASISGVKTFDPNNIGRDLRINPWTVFVDSTDKDSIFPMPSMGVIKNQTQDECFQFGDLRVEVTGNTSMYNGSVRTFWAAPTYGYFDSGRVMKPSPSQYLKQILTGSTIQENFAIKGDLTNYSEISEIFSVFETDILDMFETKFLDFCKAQYDVDDTVDYGLNFQKLMVSMMKTPKQTGTTPTELVEKIQEQQFVDINNTIEKFLGTNMYIKYGNPSNFDKKLFYTFSNYSLTDSYEWEKYVSLTPNALPYNGGTITLSSSKANFPNEWKALETYVGFSEINQLVYGNNGSFITDFFIDFNVAFTVDNVKTLSPIIKIYASQKLSESLDNTALPPTTPEDNSYAILQNGNKIEIFLGPGPKKTAVLFKPDKSIVWTLPSSTEPDDNILINNTILGYYGPLGIQNNPISSKKLRSKKLKSKSVAKSNFNQVNFKQLMDDYVASSSRFQDRVLNNLMLRLQVILPDVNNTPQPVVDSVLDGSQGKLDNWDSFKSLNDKWIAGADFKVKTLFEDVLLLDRASRNIGDKILVDIYKLKHRLDTLFQEGTKVDMLSFVESILMENNFVVMNLPAYVNFYNVQDAVKNANPRPEGTTEFANTLFGTFMNVDTRDSSAKMVCTFAGKPSENVAIKNVDFKFRDDAFDIRKSSDNPLIENQIGKTDWDKSNKVVGFNVDIGPQNQSIFYGFNVSQQNGKSTAESLEVENMMANQSSGKGSASQNISLYNLYKNRSYTCTISMMGNALIQPTMYFNLRHVPMFYGPYMITSVNHTIAPGTFETIVEGIRQPTASLPKIDNYIQSLKTNLLASIVEKNKQKSDTDATKTLANSKGGTTQNQTANAVASTSDDKKIEPSNTCSDLLFDKYKNYTPVDEPEYVKVNTKELVTKIMSRMANANVTDNGDLKYVVFASIQLSGKGNGYSNNITGVDLSRDWGIIDSFEKSYYCLGNGGTTLLPYAVFSSVDKNIDMLINRFNPRMGSIKKTDLDVLSISIAEFWFLNRLPNSADVEQANWMSMSQTDRENYISTVKSSIGEFNTLSGNLNPPQPRLNPLVDKYVYAMTSPPIFESLTITVDPKIDGPRKIWSVGYDYDNDTDCAGGRGSKQQFTSNYISSDKQTFMIELQDLLSEVGCLNVPGNESKGPYKFKITIYTSPINADGTPDNSRTDFYKSYPITFTL